jgi:pimeloyl-ACP methyl ester carboxylesterase
VARGVEQATFEGRATLAYGLERYPAAKRLLVTFPSLKSGSTRAPTGRRRMLEGVPAHRLYVGADEHTFIGPERGMAGLETTVELIGRSAGELGVAPARVVCIGTSMGAMLALAVGLTYGAGRIIAGAAPIRVGTALRGLRPGSGGRKSAAPAMIDLARTPTGDDPVAFLDRWVFDLARQASAPCRIDLLASPLDYALRSSEEFAQAAGENPLLTCRLHVGEYDLHGSIGDAFYPFVRAELGALPA